MAASIASPLRRFSPRSMAARLALSLAVAIPSYAASVRSSNPAQEPRQPVLVELFTSEGCSDCPPADALLATLDQQQFVPGAEAIVLSEHVTYWNRQGWRDPFSFAAIDARQQDYARILGLSDVYTPQMVVDGTEQFVGSDQQKLTTALERQAAKHKVEVQIENARQQPDGAVAFSVRLPAGAKGNLVAALAENATVSQVVRGENAGRTLHHVAVVRVLRQFNSSAADGRPLLLKAGDLNQQENPRNPLRLVVFLASRGDGRVLGAAEQTLPPSAPALSAP